MAGAERTVRGLPHAEAAPIFFGIIIRMFYSDRESAHFHALYGQCEALIEIHTLIVFRWSLPRRAVALVPKWAEAVGVGYGSLSEDVKENMIHEVDALVAHLYDLSESQLTHILGTLHEGWDYTARLKRALKHFHVWEKKR